MPRYKDFKVSRKKVDVWLRWLKENHESYADVVINDNALSALPENGNIVDQLPSMNEAAQLNQAISAVQPQIDAAAAQVAESLMDENDGDLMPQNQQQMGPEQGGASGANAAENLVEENYLPLPTDDNTAHERQVRRALINVLKLDWPEQGTRLSDYCTPSLQAMAFPTLFPWGPKGDFSKTNRSTYVSPTDANKHLLKYAVWDQDDDLWHYPFAEHPTWCHWAQNTAERHRVNTQKDVYLKKNPQDANLTAEELTEIINENGDRFKALLGRMNTYNRNINGSPAYLHQARKELEALMEQEGFCTLWYSCSAAENYWHDLMVIIDPKFDTREFDSEEDKAKYRRKLVRDNQHIVDHVLFERFKALFGDLFSKECLAAHWNWFRGELQGRGCYHIHGCCKLEDDTGLPKLARLVGKGRLHQLILDAKCPDKLPEIRFPSTDIDEDTWDFDPDEDFDKELTDELISEFQKDIEKGVEAHQKIVALQDFLLTTFHPKPPSDATEDIRDDSTLFQHDSGKPHPSSVSHGDYHSMSKEQQTDHYSEICDAVERHKHQTYCGVTKKVVAPGSSSTEPGITPKQAQDKCRFSYHKALSEHCKVVVTHKQYKVAGTKEKVHRMNFDMVSKRNDMWLNSHLRPFLESWKANVDFRLTIDIGKITAYMTKYVTKAEQLSSKGAQSLMRRMVNSVVESGQTIQSGLKRTMGKLLGEPMKSKQECCHLIMSNPVVYCTHQFTRVNLDNNSSKLMLDDEDGQSGEVVGKMTIVDAYSRRMDPELWLDQDEYEEKKEWLENGQPSALCQGVHCWSEAVSQEQDQETCKSKYGDYLLSIKKMQPLLSLLP